MDDLRVRYLNSRIAEYLGYHESMLDVLPSWAESVDAAYNLPHEDADFTITRTPVFGGGVMYIASYEHNEKLISVASTSGDECEAICVAWLQYMDLLQMY